MNTQQISLRVFRVNYNSGFALVNSTELLTWLINNNSGVHVVELPNVERAYFDACNQFVHDEWMKNPYVQPIVPKFENVLRSPYHVPGFVAQIPACRFFATVHRDHVAIYDNVQGAVEFMDYFTPSGLKEFSTANEAKFWLNERLVVPMLAISAYITNPIEYIMNVPLNTAVPIHYRQWWQDNMPDLQNSPFKMVPNYIDSFLIGKPNPLDDPDKA